MEINKIETRKTLENIDKTESWFFWKEIDKILAEVTKKKERRLKIRNERGDITTAAQTVRIIRKY